MMKTVVDFESEAYRRVMLLTDLAPRNVMMAKPDGSRLVFIDFASVLFGRKRDDPRKPKLNMSLDQYISPLLRWNRQRALDFDDWIDWDLEGWIDEQYAHTFPSITPEMRERYCR